MTPGAGARDNMKRDSFPEEWLLCPLHGEFWDDDRKCGF